LSIFSSQTLFLLSSPSFASLQSAPAFFQDIVCILRPPVLHVYLVLANIEALFDEEKRQDQHSEEDDGDGNFDMKWCSRLEDRECEEDEW
jgi:hypothetical protein